MDVWWWTGDDGDGYGCEASKDADKAEILAEWLGFTEGLDLADLTDDEQAQMLAAMYFLPLRSVVKADHDFIDPDSCGGWHSEGSGRRVRPAWFIDGPTFRYLMERVIDRKVS